MIRNGKRMKNMGLVFVIINDLPEPRHPQTFHKQKNLRGKHVISKHCSFLYASHLKINEKHCSFLNASHLKIRLIIPPLLPFRSGRKRS